MHARPPVAVDDREDELHGAARPRRRRELTSQRVRGAERARRLLLGTAACGCRPYCEQEQ
jgi:hypothetical protein